MTLLERRRMMLAAGEEDDGAVDVTWTPGAHLNTSGNVNSSVTTNVKSTTSSPFPVSPGQTVTIASTDPDFTGTWFAIMFYKSNGSYIYPRQQTGGGKSFSYVAPATATQARACFQPRNDDKLDTMKVYVK